MENTCENIELIYFNENIKYYEYLFDFSYWVSATVKNGYLLMCGQNPNSSDPYNGQLGLGTTNNTDGKFLICTIPGKKIKQVSLGSWNSAVVTTDGLLYTTGNNTNGQLGLGQTTDFSTNTFTQVTVRDQNNNPKSIKQVSYGGVYFTGHISTLGGHIAVVTTDGLLYTCGLNVAGQLGLNNIINQNSFQLVTQNITGKKIKQVSCGSWYTAIVTTDGLLYTCGFNSFGQLGLGNNTNTSTFTQVTIRDQNNNPKIIKEVSCGGSNLNGMQAGGHIAIVTIDGLLYTCGGNNYGQLGLGITDISKSTFQQVTITGKTINKVYCGIEYTAVVTTDELLYVCGHNYLGKLGLGITDTSKNTFQQVTTNITGKKIKHVANYIATTTIVDTSGNIYTSGWNGAGQLGIGNRLPSSNRTVFGLATSIDSSLNSVDNPYVTSMVSRNGLSSSFGPTLTTPKQMYDIGISIPDLLREFTVSELFDNGNGITVQQFINEDISVVDLYSNGTGLTVQQLFDGNITVQELRSAGISIVNLYSNGDGITVQQLISGGISIVDLYANGDGITVQQLISGGISIVDLYSNGTGITAKQLFDGGITVQELRSAGISIYISYYSTKADSLSELNILGVSTSYLVGDGGPFGPGTGYTSWKIASNSTGSSSQSVVYVNEDALDASGSYNLYQTIPCFLEGTTVLCKENGVEKYIPVEQLENGTLVKTSLDGYKQVVLIGKGSINNPEDDERSENRLYKCSTSNYPQLKEDLYITGCHSILEFPITEKQKEDTIKHLGELFVTDKKYRLMAFLDERAEPWNSKGEYTIWHIALENTDITKNYGVYVNGGLLVETCSINFLKNKSNMICK
jgi:alpha-tubulin suppressor-like RCC1 family protein